MAESWVSGGRRTTRRLMVGSVLATVTPAVAMAQDVSFKGDWETGIFGGRGRFEQVQRVADDRFVQSTVMPRKGTFSAQVTVKQDDNPLRSFCPDVDCGERAEALFMTKRAGGRLNENIRSGTQFYAFSVRLAPGWPSPRGTLDEERGFGEAACDSAYGWGVVFQLHGPDEYKGASPAFALQTWDTNGPRPVRPEFTVSLNAGTLVPGSDTINDNGVTFRLAKGGLAVGSWVDWVFEIKWADDAGGYVRAWRRDAGQARFTQVLDTERLEGRRRATLQRTAASRGRNHYWKTGFYRPNDCAITNQLWIEGPARGTSRAAVVEALWGG